jgi:hypothetical protein
MADQMTYLIHVMPLSFNDMLTPSRFQPFYDALAGMDDQKRSQFRRKVATICVEVMRNCDDWQVRAGAYDVLSKLKVTRP